VGTVVVKVQQTGFCNGKVVFFCEVRTDFSMLFRCVLCLSKL